MLLANLGILTSVCCGTHWLNRHKVVPAITKEVDPDIAASREDAHQAKIGAASMLLASGGWLYPPLGLISVGVISYNIYPILRDALNQWQDSQHTTNESYASLVTLLMLGSGNYFAAGMQNMLYHLSNHYAHKSRKNATQWITDAYNSAPGQVWRLDADNQEHQIPLTQVQAGNLIVVNTGETIPVDGRIETGMALVDQQALTGEADPAEKTVGDNALAATLVIRGRLVIRAAHSGEDNRIQQLNTLLQQTRDYKTALQLRGEHWADQAVLPAFTISALSMPALGVSPALSILYSAPLNSVRAMLSVQTAAHLQSITQQGALIKDGRVLESLPQIDTLLFDKTGTLTETLPEVANITCCGDQTADQLLSLAAAAEQRLEHPIAQAIVTKAQQQNLTLLPVSDSQYDLGLGVSVQINQQHVQVGSLRFILQAIQCTEAELPDTIRQAMQAATGHTLILVAVDGTLQGMLELRPRLRPEIPGLIARLRQRGFAHIAVISGDQQAPTQRLADSLGLDAAYGDVLPQDKAALVQQHQAQGKNVCFIGDGLNDAIAMKQANVSISLNSATPIASETAQIVLTQDNLAPISDLFPLAEQLQHRLNNSLIFWTGFGIANALSVPLLGFGPVQSSLLYLAAYGLGLKYSRRIPAQRAT
ncbi:MAG: heavy metal translocating P-type ATPase [Pseudomonadota bacterium]